MRILLFGGTGMVGAGALLECLAERRVTSVLSVSRSPTGVIHPKLEEVLHQDFLELGPLRERFREVDACFFCLGVSVLGLDEKAYTRITYEYTLAAARTLLAASPAAIFCYISGAHTDSTERGRTMWARVKGRTENTLLGLGFRRAYMLRPGFIQPVAGVRSKTAWYQAFYTLLRPLSPTLVRLFPGAATTTALLGRAMIALAVRGSTESILESRDINRLAQTA